MSRELKVLFLCTGNSCRSQMAEGWANHLHSNRLRASSAGTSPGTVDRRAVQVMAEAGVAIDHHESKSVDRMLHVDFDLVVTVCDAASKACPVFPGATEVIHHSFDDPPRLAATATSKDGALTHYRRVRDEIRSFVEGLAESALPPEESQP